MNFQSASGAKAWRDIWGSGQGIGILDKVVPAAALIDRLAGEYAEARARICT
jgi:nitronate monooxygenase